MKSLFAKTFYLAWTTHSHVDRIWQARLFFHIFLLSHILELIFTSCDMFLCISNKYSCCLMHSYYFMSNTKETSLQSVYICSAQSLLFSHSMVYLPNRRPKSHTSQSASKICFCINLRGGSNCKLGGYVGQSSFDLKKLKLQ